MGSSLDGLLGRYELNKKVWSVLYDRSTGTYSFYHGLKKTRLEKFKLNVKGGEALKMIEKIIANGYVLVDESIKYVDKQDQIDKILDLMNGEEEKIDIISELEKAKGGSDE